MIYAPSRLPDDDVQAKSGVASAKGGTAMRGRWSFAAVALTAVLCATVVGASVAGGGHRQR